MHRLVAADGALQSRAERGSLAVGTHGHPPSGLHQVPIHVHASMCLCTRMLMCSCTHARTRTNPRWHRWTSTSWPRWRGSSSSRLHAVAFCWCDRAWPVGGRDERPFTLLCSQYFGSCSARRTQRSCTMLRQQQVRGGVLSAACCDGGVLAGHGCS